MHFCIQNHQSLRRFVCFVFVLQLGALPLPILSI